MEEEYEWSTEGRTVKMMILLVEGAIRRGWGGAEEGEEWTGALQVHG
jgi:hypothetical protein